MEGTEPHVQRLFHGCISERVCRPQGLAGVGFSASTPGLYTHKKPMELIKTIGVAALALTIIFTPLSTVHAQVSAPKDPEVRAQLIALLTQQIQLLQAQIAQLKAAEPSRTAKKRSIDTRSGSKLMTTKSKVTGSADIALNGGSSLMTNTDSGSSLDRLKRVTESTHPKVEVVSSDIINNEKIELKLQVTAADSQDYYVPTSVSQAVRYEITPEFTGTKRVAFTSSAKKKGDVYVIEEGEEETFELHVQLAGDGTYAISFAGLRVMEEPDGSKKVYEPEGGTYTTEAVSL